MLEMSTFPCFIGNVIRIYGTLTRLHDVHVAGSAGLLIPPHRLAVAKPKKKNGSLRGSDLLLVFQRLRLLAIGAQIGVAAGYWSLDWRGWSEMFHSDGVM